MNNSSNDTGNFDVNSIPKNKVVTATVAILSSALTIVPNLWVAAKMVFQVFLRSKRHNSFLVVLLCLSLCDFLVGVCSLMFAASFAFGIDEYFRSVPVCYVLIIISEASISASFLQVELICLERIIALKAPFRFRRWFSKKRSLLYIVVMWMISALLFTVDIAFGINDSVGEVCLVVNLFGDPKNKIMYYASVVLVEYVVIIVTFIFLEFQIKEKLLNKNVPSKRNSSNTIASDLDYEQPNNPIKGATSLVSFNHQAGTTENISAYGTRSIEHKPEVFKMTADSRHTDFSVLRKKLRLDSKHISNHHTSTVSFSAGGLSSVSHNPQRQKQFEEFLKITRMLIFIMTVVVAPGAVGLICQQFFTSLNVPPYRHIFFVLTILQSSINPYVYGFRTTNWKECYFRICGKTCTKAVPDRSENMQSEQIGNSSVYSITMTDINNCDIDPSARAMNVTSAD